MRKAGNRLRNHCSGSLFPLANLLHTADVRMTTLPLFLATLLSTIEHTRSPGASIEVRRKR